VKRIHKITVRLVASRSQAPDVKQQESLKPSTLTLPSSCPESTVAVRTQCQSRRPKVCTLQDSQTRNAPMELGAPTEADAQSQVSHTFCSACVSGV
jgi:hypothetical protein